LHLAELEAERLDDVQALRLRLRAEELPGLAVMIGERLRALPQLVARLRRGVRDEAALTDLARRLGPQRTRPERVGLVVEAPSQHRHAHVAVALEVAQRADGAVDRDLVEV